MILWKDGMGDEKVHSLCEQLGQPSSQSHTKPSHTDKHSAQSFSNLPSKDFLQEAESAECLCDLEISPVR